MSFSKIVHFSYHKCLTVYYSNIMRDFCELYKLKYKHFNSDEESFKSEVVKDTLDVLSLNNSKFDLSLIRDYRGSHLVRDPRDLLISGYHYHKWCPEEWCLNKEYRWLSVKADPLYIKYMLDTNEWCEGVCYQDYMKTLGIEKGIFLEMIWRSAYFKNMEDWDYENKNILELKYEDIIDHEIKVFSNIFDYYGFPEAWKDDWLRLVDKYSRKNQKMSNTSHTRNGNANQWVESFSDKNKVEFKDRYGNLLIKLGYEKDLNW